MSREVSETIHDNIASYDVKLDQTIREFANIANPTQDEATALTNAQNEKTHIRDIINLTLPQINREVRICLAFEDWTLESVLNAVSETLIRDEALRPDLTRIIEADLDGMRRLQSLLGKIAQNERRIKGAIEFITGLFLQAYSASISVMVMKSLQLCLALLYSSYYSRKR